MENVDKNKYEKLKNLESVVILHKWKIGQAFDVVLDYEFVNRPLKGFRYLHVNGFGI